MDRDNELLLRVGLCLMQLQRVEYVVSACLAALPRLAAGVHLSLEDVLSPDDARRKYTLGQLLRPLRSGLPLGELDNRLAEFVEHRNAFTHNYWLEATNSWPLDESSYASAFNYVISLMREADDLERVFRGLFAVIAVVAHEQLGVEHALDPKFLAERSNFWRATGDEDA